MKQLLVLTLALTLIFPAYCFGNPVEALPIEDEMMEVVAGLMADEEIVNEVMWIMEDGIIEEEELAGLMVVVEEKTDISPNQARCLLFAFF